MDDLLAPFMSDPEELTQLKGPRAVLLYPPIDGLIYWYWRHGDWVEKDFPLYIIASSFEALPHEIIDVPSPTRGYLFIHAEEGWVFRTTHIATIDPDTAPV